MYPSCTIKFLRETHRGVRENMALELFRRHTKGCLPKLKQKTPKLSPIEMRLYKGKDCRCPIWYSGTHDGHRHPRKSLGLNSWDAATKKLRDIEAGKVAESKPKLSVIEAIDKWIADRETKGVRPSTLESYRGLGEKLKAFAALQIGRASCRERV